MTEFTVELDPAALDDLASIRDYIAASSGLAVAARFVARVLDHLEGFGATPKRGRLREDIRPGLRVTGWRRVLTTAFIVDEPNRRVVTVAVLYRGRDADKVLSQRKPG